MLVLCAQDHSLSLTERRTDRAWATVVKCSDRRELIDAVQVTAADRQLEPVAQPPPVHLSPRERETLGLLAQGLSNKEIAARLDLGTRTVDTYRASLMKKLGIHHLAGLVKYALRHRLTPISD